MKGSTIQFPNPGAFWRQAPCGLGVLNREARILELNQALAQMLGRFGDEVEGRFFADFLTRADREAFLTALAQSALTRQPISDLGVEIAGERLPLPVSLSARWSDDEPPRLNLCVTEVGGRSVRESELRRELQEAELFKSIVGASNDAICSISSTGLILTWNRGAERLYGYTAMEAVGQPLQLIVPEGGQAESSSFAERVLHGESVSFEAVRRHKDGGSINVAISGGPIYDQRGRIVSIAAVHRDIRSHVRHEGQMRFVMRELAHRTKNLLAVIQSIERQTARTASSKDEFHERFSSRLQALAASHDLLVEMNWLGARIGDLIERQLAAFADRIGGRLSLEGPPLRLSPEAAQTIGLAVHELATNATKYGAFSNSEGAVSVTWGLAPDEAGAPQFQLRWQERGGPPVAAPQRRGFGSLAIERLAAQALNGRAELLYAPEGVRWTLLADAAQVQSLEG